MSMTAHISDLVFFLSRCHVEGAGQKGDREDSQGLCHHCTGSAACSGIKFIYIGKAEVESKMQMLDELAFHGIKQLKGIRKIHHMEVCIQRRFNFC